ncbi:hypothetical protein [Paractinoplanes atraurantiacus]|uniref:hypothetical protein n=1 Tax=Paractinoplanes atraurantiacus TaxID=1036182 RepID=UPI0015CF707A|nr:hypothetical protein [Actinoplanes atraurantiacus]
MPFAVHADLNNTTTPYAFFSGPGCTGIKMTLPAGDFHSFASFNAVSVRAN